jgi:hypothetical protein
MSPVRFKQEVLLDESHVGTSQPLVFSRNWICKPLATLKGMKVTRASGAVDDFSAVYVDLEAESDEQIVITDLSAKKELRAFG